MQKIAIIGSGISALTIAHKLKDVTDVTLFEKSRGVGGRMSTRSASPYQFDHGAQYFTVKTNAFRKFIDPMIKEGIIVPWNARFVEIDKDTVTKRHDWNSDYPHYIGSPKMNSIGKYLAKNLNVHLNSHVAKIEEKQNKWDIYSDKGQNLGSFDWVISTAPSEQASKLLAKKFKYYETLLEKKMLACFSLMLGLKEPLSIAWDAALVKNSTISWVSFNSSKPKRPYEVSLLVHSTNEWAETNLYEEKETIQAKLCQEASKILDYDVNKAHHMALHVWRFANSEKQNNRHSFLLDTKNKLAACGDWCIQGRVEAAFTSGSRLALELKKLLKI